MPCSAYIYELCNTQYLMSRTYGSILMVCGGSGSCLSHWGVHHCEAHSHIHITSVKLTHTWVTTLRLTHSWWSKAMLLFYRVLQYLCNKMRSASLCGGQSLVPLRLWLCNMCLLQYVAKILQNPVKPSLNCIGNKNSTTKPI